MRREKKCATYATYFIIVVPLCLPLSFSPPLSLPLCCKVARKTSKASRLGARTSIKRKWQRAGEGEGSPAGRADEVFACQ